MNTYKINFTGRASGAIGKIYPITITEDKMDTNKALKNMNNKIRRGETLTNEDKAASCKECIDKLS